MKSYPILKFPLIDLFHYITLPFMTHQTPGLYPHAVSREPINQHSRKGRTGGVLLWKEIPYHLYAHP